MIHGICSSCGCDCHPDNRRCQACEWAIYQGKPTGTSISLVEIFLAGMGLGLVLFAMRCLP